MLHGSGRRWPSDSFFSPLTVVWIGVTLRVKTANGVIYSGKDSVLTVVETPALDGAHPTETVPTSGDSNQESKTGPEAEKAPAEKVAETEEAPKSQPAAAAPESKTVEVQAEAKDSNAASGPTAAATQPEPNASGNKRASGPVVALRRGCRANQPPPVAGMWRHANNAPTRTVGAVFTFAADGSIRGARGAQRGTWSQWGSNMILRWPNKDAPGGVWIDRVQLSPDRMRYDGFNQRRRGDPRGESGRLDPKRVRLETSAMNPQPAPHPNNRSLRRLWRG